MLALIYEACSKVDNQDVRSLIYRLYAQHTHQYIGCMYHNDDMLALSVCYSDAYCYCRWCSSYNRGFTQIIRSYKLVRNDRIYKEGSSYCDCCSKKLFRIKHTGIAYTIYYAKRS